jgi:hypothetical protein
MGGSSMGGSSMGGSSMYGSSARARALATRDYTPPDTPLLWPAGAAK